MGKQGVLNTCMLAFDVYTDVTLSPAILDYDFTRYSARNCTNANLGL